MAGVLKKKEASCELPVKKLAQPKINKQRHTTTGKTTGTDPGIINLRALAPEGNELAATVNSEGKCIILLTAVPADGGECKAGDFVKC